MRSAQLFLLLTQFVLLDCLAAAWRNTAEFSLSKSSAYRWKRIFERETGRYRSQLFRLRHPPPQEEDVSPNPIGVTMQMFGETLAVTGKDPFAAFQLHFQQPLYN